MRTLRLTSAACGLSLSVTCVGVAVATAGAPSAVAATASDFYNPPASVPQQPGTLIKSQPVITGLSMWGKTTRIMYSSRDESNRPMAITGAYMEPWAAWKGPGPRPVVAYSVGTIGQGDQCAPSRMLAFPVNLSTVNSLGVNYENQGINNLLAKGVAVVLTDYAGLGTPDRPHTYMNHDDQAHAVLDAARVASKVPGSSVTAQSKVATYGYSQGGGAAGAAAETAPTYAPELDVAAAYAGAPPADLEKVLGGVDGSAITGVIGYFINGAKFSNPSVTAFAEANISDAGRAALAKISGQCALDSVVTYGSHRTSEWTKSGEPLADVMHRNADMTNFVRKQRTGLAKPNAAVRVATGVIDDIVPHAQAKQLALDWCALGANVTYAPIGGVSTGPKSMLNHAGPMLTDQLAARDWVVDRLAGKPAVSNCGQVSSMK